MLATVWSGQPGPPGRIPVIGLRSRSELSVFAGPGIGGVYCYARPFPGTLVIGGGSDSEGLRATKHELAHRLSFWFLPLQPAWFSEGVASFLETVRVDHKRGLTVVGQAPDARLNDLAKLRILPADRLFGDEPSDPLELARFEATSWLLVHDLVNHRAPAFARFQQRLRALERPPQAWAAEFADLDTEALPTELRRYASYGEGRSISIPAVSWTGTIQARVLADSEVHGLRAFLYGYAHAPGRPPSVEDARREIVEAVREEPSPVDALAVQFYLLRKDQGVDRNDLARRVSQTHPDALLGWLMMAEATGLGNPARQSALTRALAIAPDEGEVAARFAMLKAAERQWDQALMFSTKALRLHVVDPGILRFHIQALANTGRCDEAAIYVDSLSKLLSPLDAGRLGAAWASDRARCDDIAARRLQKAPQLNDVEPEGQDPSIAH